MIFRKVFQPSRVGMRVCAIWMVAGVCWVGNPAWAQGGVQAQVQASSQGGDEFQRLFVLRKPKTISKILDRHGELIGIIGDEQRIQLAYSEIPQAFISAVVATEDAEFWSHSGVTAKGVLRAGWNFVSSMGKRKEGFSTLTMQLVRTITNRREKTLERKFDEILLARRLEEAYTKKQIFEMYANEVWFGNTRYGLGMASLHFFGKPVSRLNVEECALLAGILQNPAYLNPYGRDAAMQARVKNRRNHVLDRMVAEGYLPEAKANVMKTKPIKLARRKGGEDAIAPHAVEEIRQYVAKKYGQSLLQNGGLEIQTTLDSAWQQAASDAIKQGLRAVDRRRGFRFNAVKFASNPEEAAQKVWRGAVEVGDLAKGVVVGWNGSKANVRFGTRNIEVPESAFAWAGKGLRGRLGRGATLCFHVKAVDAEGFPTRVELDQESEVDGALLAADPQNGEIRAMVGGYDFKRSAYNRALQAQRQVGSTMKAFVYGAALASGKTPASFVEDVPTRYTYDGQSYEPKNYELDFWGPVSIWEAMCHSRNVAAVRMVEEVGAEGVIEFSRACGIQGALKPYPSMALGSADLTLKEMVRGYATFAAGGRQTPSLTLIKRIVDRNGKTLEASNGVLGDQVLDPESNFQLIQCLEGVTEQGTATKALELDWPVAGKTGTTSDYSDAWFMGFSTRLACGVWVGLDDRKPIYKGAAGGSVALPIWVDFMKVALPGTTKEDFKAPEGMEWAEIDKSTGLLASSDTPMENRLRLAFKPGTAPKETSTPDTIRAAQEAKAKAGSQAVEERPWVMGTPESHIGL